MSRFELLDRLTGDAVAEADTRPALQADPDRYIVRDRITGETMDPEPPPYLDEDPRARG